MVCKHSVETVKLSRRVNRLHSCPLSVSLFSQHLTALICAPLSAGERNFVFSGCLFCELCVYFLEGVICLLSRFLTSYALGPGQPDFCPCRTVCGALCRVLDDLL